MKPLLILVVVVCSLFTSKSFAADDKGVAEAALKSFNVTFSSATEVKWSFTEKMYRADFSLSGQYAAAFYNEEGELVAVTRNMSISQLPITLQASLKANYTEFWISNLFEVTTTDNGTEYYVTLESAEQKLVLKASSSSAWASYKKTRKP